MRRPRTTSNASASTSDEKATTVPTTSRRTISSNRRSPPGMTAPPPLTGETGPTTRLLFSPSSTPNTPTSRACGKNNVAGRSTSSGRVRFNPPTPIPSRCRLTSRTRPGSEGASPRTTTTSPSAIRSWARCSSNSRRMAWPTTRSSCTGAITGRCPGANATPTIKAYTHR